MDMTRIDTANNARRFYRMEIMPGLFGDWSLVRVDWFEDEKTAKDARFDIQMQKAKRGYD